MRCEMFVGSSAKMILLTLWSKKFLLRKPSEVKNRYSGNAELFHMPGEIWLVYDIHLSTLSLFDTNMTFHFFDVTILIKCMCRNDSEGFIYADTSYIQRNNFVVSAVINVPSLGRHLERHGRGDMMNWMLRWSRVAPRMVPKSSWWTSTRQVKAIQDQVTTGSSTRQEIKYTTWPSLSCRTPPYLVCLTSSHSPKQTSSQIWYSIKLEFASHTELCDFLLITSSSSSSRCNQCYFLKEPKRVMCVYLAGDIYFHPPVTAFSF